MYVVLNMSHLSVATVSRMCVLLTALPSAGQEQPLLLADLLEEEKREQQRQQPAAAGVAQQQQQVQQVPGQIPLSEADYTAGTPGVVHQTQAVPMSRRECARRPTVTG